MAEQGTAQPVQSNDQGDRYPTAQEGIRRILEEGTFEQVYIDRLEVRFLANGEATYRYWAPRAEDSEGGVLSAP